MMRLGVFLILGFVAINGQTITTTQELSQALMSQFRIFLKNNHDQITIAQITKDDIVFTNCIINGISNITLDPNIPSVGDYNSLQGISLGMPIRMEDMRYDCDFDSSHVSGVISYATLNSIITFSVINREITVNQFETVTGPVTAITDNTEVVNLDETVKEIFEEKANEIMTELIGCASINMKAFQCVKA